MLDDTLLSDIPVIDGHNDSLRSLWPFSDERVNEFLHGRGDGHIDLPRARRGGLVAGFFALHIPPVSGSSKEEILITSTNGELEGYEVPLAEALPRAHVLHSTLTSLRSINHLQQVARGAIQIVRNTSDIDRNITEKSLGFIIHFEGAEAIDQDLEGLEDFFHAGLRSLGIVWSRPNIFGTGVPFRFPHSPDTGPGLTAPGRALVRACNQLGILLDASHLNERGFWDLAATTSAPLVATHSAAHALCPCSRNLTDKQLDAIRDSDGLVGINFEVSAIRGDGKDEPNTSLEVLVDHIEYLVERIGIERVGFGSDFDGATMSHALADAAALPSLLGALHARGYGRDELRKLAHENWLRVLRKTWKDDPALDSSSRKR